MPVEPLQLETVEQELQALLQAHLLPMLVEAGEEVALDLVQVDRVEVVLVV
jgi:hypothetical protein